MGFIDISEPRVAIPPPPPPTTSSSHFEPNGDLPKARRGIVFECVDEVQKILETIRMDSKNQQSLEHKDSFPSRADHLDFELEHEAQIDFRQLASVAMDQELGLQDDQSHILGGAPDFLTIEETLDLPIEDEDPSVSDPSHLDFPMKKTRNRATNIMQVKQKDLNGRKSESVPKEKFKSGTMPLRAPPKLKGLLGRVDRH